MAFLAAFDQLNQAGLHEEASQLLYAWMINRETALYDELRARPVLQFWSLHPGNPDFHSANAQDKDRERRPGWAYLLTGRTDVEQALDELSMRPYESWDEHSYVEVPWVLSMNDTPEHQYVWNAMHASMADPDMRGKMDRAVRLQWTDTKADLAHIDVRQYFRRVALSFTGEYFGIPSTYIFEQAPSWLAAQGPSPSGIENLEQWSGEGYENFIWKIHARHFHTPAPAQGREFLAKIYLLILVMKTHPMPDTVIARFNMNEVQPRLDPLRNMVGMIQGLVDNMMTSACIALRQLIDNALVEQAADWDLARLIRELRTLQAAHEAPSPFLPRFGQVHATRGPSAVLDRHPQLQGAHIACAIGAAMTDPTAPGGVDIRLGYGMHECIGRELGDELAARALQPLLQLRALQVVTPLSKQWGWIPQQFVVAADHPQRRSQVIIDQLANAAPPRPNPYSQWSSRPAGVEQYASWPSLNHRGWFSRHLPPADAQYTDFLHGMVPPAGVGRLFQRPMPGAVTGRSTLWFAFFAQWLTDSFLRTDPVDRRRTTSNHQIDLCQIYGLDDRTTEILRAKVDGLMKMDIGANGKTYPPRLFDAQGMLKPEFSALPYVVDGKIFDFIRDSGLSADKVPYLCASGLERGNSTVGYTALNTLFLREHNRICLALKAGEGAAWDDERLFQTARMILTLIEIKIIIEEYINHINTDIKLQRPFAFDPDFLFAERRRWYRTNWISVEFDLLYRWHSLVPDAMIFGGQSYTTKDMRGDNQPLFSLGLGQVVRDASTQRAGSLRLFNTPDFLWPAEQAAVLMAREAELRPFNEYRKRFGIPPMTSFAEFHDQAASAALAQLYGDIDKVEFLPGIMAEQPMPWQGPLPGPGHLFGTAMMVMVGYDAFTHALTNPLLSEHVLTAEHLTATGLGIVMATSSLDDLLRRNGEGSGASFD